MLEAIHHGSTELLVVIECLLVEICNTSQCSQRRQVVNWRETVEMSCSFRVACPSSVVLQVSTGQCVSCAYFLSWNMGDDSVVEYHETKSESEDSRGNCIQMLGTDQGNTVCGQFQWQCVFPR